MKPLKNPRINRSVNGWLTLAFVALIPVSMAMGWVNSVAFVSALSLWALVAGHWSAWAAARVEVKQYDDADVQQVLDLLREMKRGMENDGEED